MYFSSKYFSQVFLDKCRCGLYNRALRLNESDESDSMPEESEEEFNSDDESDDADNES